MELIEYLPPFLRNVREYKALNSAFDIENSEISKAVEGYIRECFVLTAEDEGLSRMESILSLDGTGKSIELRRINILAELGKSKQSLSSILKDYSSVVEYEFTGEYDLTVEVMPNASGYLPAIKKILDKYLPCNIALTVSQKYATHAMTGKYTHGQLSKYTHTQVKEKV